MAKKINKLTIFIAKFINGIEKTNRDKRFTWADLFNFIPAALTAPEAFKGIKNVEFEFKNLTKEQKVEVVALFNENLNFEGNLTEEKVEEIFEDLLKLLKSIDNLITKPITP